MKMTAAAPSKGKERRSRCFRSWPLDPTRRAALSGTYRLVGLFRQHVPRKGGLQKIIGSIAAFSRFIPALLRAGAVLGWCH